MVGKEPDHYEHRDKSYYRRNQERIREVRWLTRNLTALPSLWFLSDTKRLLAQLTPALVPPQDPDIPIINPPDYPIAGVPSDHQPYKKGNIIELRTVRRPGRERSVSNSTPDLLTPAPTA